MRIGEDGREERKFGVKEGRSGDELMRRGARRDVAKSRCRNQVAGGSSTESQSLGRRRRKVVQQNKTLCLFHR